LTDTERGREERIGDRFEIEEGEKERGE